MTVMLSSGRVRPIIRDSGVWSGSMMAGSGTTDGWEYLILSEADQERLSALGKEGWELVTVVDRSGTATLYFKRRLPSFRETVTLEQRRTYYASVGRDPDRTQEPAQ